MDPRSIVYPRNGVLPRFEQRNPILFNSYRTLIGPKQGIPMHALFLTESFFNGPGVSELVIDMCDRLPLRKRFNDAYTRGNFTDKAKICDFFHLPRDDIDYFTSSWGVVTIWQKDITTGRFYKMVIIHSGVFETEYEIFSHMNADEINVRIFEVSNYPRYEDIPFGRFNVEWNNFDDAMDFKYMNRYRWITKHDFNDFHRAMQYILLSFYFTDRCMPRPYTLMVEETEGREVSYEEGLNVSYIYNHIAFSGKHTNCYMAIKKYDRDFNGKRVLQERVIAHNNADD